MKIQRGTAKVLDDIKALVAEFRWVTSKTTQAVPCAAVRPSIPNPRRIKPFKVGDLVVLLSQKHQHKKVTVIGQKTEDFLNVVLDNSNKTYRKLRHLESNDSPSFPPRWSTLFPHSATSPSCLG